MLQAHPPLTNSDALVQVNTATGQVSIIGPTNLDGIQAMATLGDVLYGWDFQSGLVTLDTTFGLATDVAPAGVHGGGGDGGDFQWLAVTPDGRLLGGRSQVFEVDPIAGVDTSVGLDTGIDLRGAVFASFAYSYGAGCGATDPVRLSVSGSIRPGGLLTTNSVNHRVSSTPVFTLGLLMIGLSNESTSGAPLPLDLGPFLGATGCELGVSPDLTASNVVIPAVGTLTVLLPIPNVVSVDRFYLQHVALDMQAPGASVWSNSIGVVIQ